MTDQIPAFSAEQARARLGRHGGRTRRPRYLYSCRACRPDLRDYNRQHSGQPASPSIPPSHRSAPRPPPTAPEAPATDWRASIVNRQLAIVNRQAERRARLIGGRKQWCTAVCSPALCHWRLVRQCFVNGRSGECIPAPTGQECCCAPSPRQPEVCGRLQPVALFSCCKRQDAFPFAQKRPHRTKNPGAFRQMSGNFAFSSEIPKGREHRRRSMRLNKNSAIPQVWRHPSPSGVG